MALFLPLVLIASVSACSREATSPGGSAAASLRVTLSDTVVATGSGVRATVTALSASGQALTSVPSVRWRTTDTAIAKVSADGTVTGVRAGSVSVVAEQLSATGAVALSGASSVRAKWAPGTWYPADSMFVPLDASYGEMTAVPIAGSRVALVLAGPSTVTWKRVAPASVILDAAGKLTLNTSRIVETTPSATFTSTILQADFNGDGNTDLHFGNHGADILNPPPGQRDVPKVLLGDGQGGFRESPLASPAVQQHAAAVGPTRAGGPVDIMVMSGLCYVISISGGDTVPVPYRGSNWIPLCAAPGPFILRGKGDGTFTYDNVSLPSFLATSIVPDSAGAPRGLAGSALCDLNGDGWNDLVVTLKTPSVYEIGYVYLNDKAGRFLSTPLPMPRPPRGGRYNAEVYCRDLDGDGRLDLLVTRVDPTNPAGGSDVVSDWNILHGNGDGTFVNVTTTALPGQSLSVNTHEIAFADINGDGNVDLIGARTEYLDQPPPVWFGTATKGVFRIATKAEVPTLTWSGDGKSPILTVTAHGLTPVTVGNEVMLVSRLYRGEVDGNLVREVLAVPKGNVMVRVYRRAPGF
jgi:hypothetical protein